MNTEVVELIGYAASILVFSTFYMKTMIPLRVVAIGSNIAFLAYGWLDGLYPVMILHALLLPLNVLRLIELKNLIEDVRNASQGDFSMDWLIPFTTRKSFNKGEVFCRKGDVADSIHYIVKGRLRIEETGIVLKEGQIVGEIGLFSPHKERTVTLVCETDVETLAASEQKLMQLYYQNPDIGFYLTRLIIGRLIENQARLTQA